MMKLFAIPALALLALASDATQAFAEEAKIVATFRDWAVVTRPAGDDLTCYILSEPKDKSPKSLSHGDVFMLVSSWKSGAAVNQPSFMTGYQQRERGKPTIRIGSDKWEMYTSDNEAFIESAADEKRLISAMRRGSTMRVQTTSSRGNLTSYEVSLLGVSAALDRMAQECS